LWLFVEGVQKHIDAGVDHQPIVLVVRRFSYAGQPVGLLIGVAQTFAAVVSVLQVAARSTDPQQGSN
jgi:hypothetical protein